tara:strand:- start:289 stop:507 length:219 start_codon:yes stop_codon:yes gene_type:complete
MTKKDYIQLARLMKELRKGVAHEKPLNGIDGMQTIILNGVINKLANYCMLDNPKRFDRDKFIKATQLKEVSK